MKNLLRYFILAGISCAGIFAWNCYSPDKSLGMTAWLLVAFFTIVYAAAHFYIVAGEKGRAGIFVTRFMGVTTMRFVLFLIVLLAFTFTHKPQAVVFIFHFLALYFLFTIVEVSAFYSKFSSKS